MDSPDGLGASGRVEDLFSPTLNQREERYKSLEAENFNLKMRLFELQQRQGDLVPLSPMPAALAAPRAPLAASSAGALGGEEADALRRELNESNLTVQKQAVKLEEYGVVLARAKAAIERLREDAARRQTAEDAAQSASAAREEAVRARSALEASLRSERVSASARLADLKLESAALREEVERARRAEGTALARASDLEARLDDASRGASALEARAAAADAMLEAQRKSSSEAEARRRSEAEEAEALRREARGLAEELSRARSAEERGVRAVQTLRAREEEVSALGRRLQDRETEIRDLRVKVEEREAEARLLGEQAVRARGERDAALRQQSLRDEERAAEAEGLRGRAEELEGRLRESERDRRALLERAQGLSARLEAQAGAALADAQRLQSLLAERDAKISELSNGLARAELNLGKLRSDYNAATLRRSADSEDGRAALRIVRSNTTLSREAFDAIAALAADWPRLGRALQSHCAAVGKALREMRRCCGQSEGAANEGASPLAAIAEEMRGAGERFRRLADEGRAQSEQAVARLAEIAGQWGAEGDARPLDGRARRETRLGVDALEARLDQWGAGVAAACDDVLQHLQERRASEAAAQSAQRDLLDRARASESRRSADAQRTIDALQCRVDALLRAKGAAEDDAAALARRLRQSQAALDAAQANENALRARGAQSEAAAAERDRLRRRLAESERGRRALEEDARALEARGGDARQLANEKAALLGAVERLQSQVAKRDSQIRQLLSSFEAASSPPTSASSHPDANPSPPRWRAAARPRARAAAPAGGKVERWLAAQQAAASPARAGRPARSPLAERGQARRQDPRARR